jgi:hypothetical protein
MRRDRAGLAFLRNQEIFVFPSCGVLIGHVFRKAVEGYRSPGRWRDGEDAWQARKRCGGCPSRLQSGGREPNTGGVNMHPGVQIAPPFA